MSVANVVDNQQQMAYDRARLKLHYQLEQTKLNAGNQPEKQIIQNEQAIKQSDSARYRP